MLPVELRGIGDAERVLQAEILNPETATHNTMRNQSLVIWWPYRKLRPSPPNEGGSKVIGPATLETYMV